MESIPGAQGTRRGANPSQGTNTHMHAAYNLQDMSFIWGKKLEYTWETPEEQGKHANSKHT